MKICFCFTTSCFRINDNFVIFLFINILFSIDFLSLISFYIYINCFLNSKNNENIIFDFSIFLIFTVAMLAQVLVLCTEYTPQHFGKSRAIEHEPEKKWCSYVLILLQQSPEARLQTICITSLRTLHGVEWSPDTG